MITIHQRNQNVSNNYDTFSKSAQIHFLEYCQTNISLTGSQIRQSWVCLFSLFLPSTNKSLFENPIFCYHWWLTIHQWAEFQYPIPCMSKFPVLSISLFSAESGHNSSEKFLVLPTKSWNDTNTFSKFTIFPDDKIRATVQLITYTVPQNCLSIFTIHNSQLFYLCPCQLRGWASDFFLEGRHLSKIRLGANVTSGRSRIFPGGRQLPKVLLFFNFLPKTAWKWKNLDPQGGRVPGAPPWIRQW